MERYLTTQAFVAVTAALLVLTFYILYAINATGQRDMLTELILIILEITLLAILATLRNIESLLGKKKGKK